MFLQGQSILYTLVCLQFSFVPSNARSFRDIPNPTLNTELNWIHKNRSVKVNNFNISLTERCYQKTIIISSVSLTNYKAYKSASNQATITWTTANEINNDHFTLERSSNGIDFTTIAIIRGVNHDNTYTQTDDQPLPGDNHYRLSQSDQDGKTTYFSIIKLKFGPKNTLVLAPNPAYDQLQVQFDHEEKSNISVSILALNGSPIKQWTFNKTEYEWNETINISNIQQGSYILQVKGKTFIKTERFLKN